MPMIDIPVASLGPGQYALTDGCPQIKPFTGAVLRQLYPSRTYFL